MRVSGILTSPEALMPLRQAQNRPTANSVSRIPCPTSPNMTPNKKGNVTMENGAVRERERARAISVGVD